MSYIVGLENWSVVAKSILTKSVLTILWHTEINRIGLDQKSVY